jgi:hypothetical protein
LSPVFLSCRLNLQFFSSDHIGLSLKARAAGTKDGLLIYCFGSGRARALRPKLRST